MGHGYAESMFDMSLLELLNLNLLRRYVPDSSGYVGTYYVDDIVRIERI